jgi:amidohydrolase
MASNQSLDNITVEAHDQLSGAVALRRTLHRHPEIGLHNPITADALLEALDGIDLAITRHQQTSGISALFTGSQPGPTILLRADTDGLPMPEDTGLDFASASENRMHACGHDTHVAMLVGAAKLLSNHRDDIAGRVLFMFQPGEEGYGGADYMLGEGLLDVPPLADGTPSPVTAAFALHTIAGLPTGYVTSRGGSLMASSDELEIRVTGKGGHASDPSKTIDPIPIACEIVQALQMMVTRRLDVFDPGVITVAKITAGTTTNVIPELAVIEGTMRAVSEATRQRIHDGVRRVAEGICAAHDADVEVIIRTIYPVTVNNTDFTNFALGIADELVGADHAIRAPHPVMGAEDFSFVLQRLPGAMMFLGATPPDIPLATAAPNHSNRVYFDEDCMRTGIAMHAGVVLRHLAPGR